MKLILGLGNPGSEYTTSRHNVGFMALDHYIDMNNLPAFRLKAKFQAEISEFSHQGEKIILAKPTTFYNLSGQAARAIIDFYRIDTKDLLVIHDDSALEFGKIRLRRGGQDAGNNGLKSLYQHIEPVFWHVRIGTNTSQRQRIGDVNFVLGGFSANEMNTLKEWALPTTALAVETFLTGNLEPTTYQTPPKTDDQALIYGAKPYL